MNIFNSLLLFTLSGLCEIGGGYLVWLWVREGKSIWLALGGAIFLTTYGFVATLQPATFGRAYAAYGGVFIILSIIWGWRIDNVAPDRPGLGGNRHRPSGCFGNDVRPQSLVVSLY